MSPTVTTDVILSYPLVAVIGLVAGVLLRSSGRTGAALLVPVACFATAFGWNMVLHEFADRNTPVIQIYREGLTAIPDGVLRRKVPVQHLSLSGNQITAVPPEIGQLSHLRRLELSGNQLTLLPPEIGRLAALEEMVLSDNRLTALPPEFAGLTNLTTLVLVDNRFTVVPPEVLALPNLRMVNLGGNPIAALPPDVPPTLQIYLD